ncbi:MAG TPA: hypothetical protein VFC70_04450 [Oscillospiraceae bacterium]|nr:hypothetical protein [Oscillospiraceae bacterium]
MTTLSAPAYSKTAPYKRRYRLDNAGKLYPAISTSKWNWVFRITAVMKMQIDPEKLQKAADRVMPRFPTMAVQMRTGLFWYYLEENPIRLIVRHDKGVICAPFPWREKHTFLLRILYTRQHISVEIFHAVTDGTGAMVFLKTLIAEYLRLCGISIPTEMGVLDLEVKSPSAETEDAFQHMPLPQSKGRKFSGKAYHFPGKMKNPNTACIMTFSIPVPLIKEKAKSIGVTITEYLTAAILYIGYMKQTEEHPRKILPIRVSVPVNMRRFFPTESLRNCSWFVRPEIASPFDGCTFEEIALKVQLFMKQALLPENLYAGIAPNVANEKNLLVRLMPLPLKNLIIKMVFKAMVSRAVTTTLTNLGQIEAPDELLSQVDYFDAILGPSFVPAANCAIVTTGATMRLTFTSNHKYPILPFELEQLLIEQGIPVRKEIRQA